MKINKLIPPTGHKLYFRDLIPSKKPFPFNGYLLNSGTAALYFVLNNLNIPKNSKVVVPAYSCPTVAAAVLKAGHNPILCDISPFDLGYDIEQLEKIVKIKNPAAVVWVNLFGLQKAIPKLKTRIIVDNAQAQPHYNNIENADAVIYSFGRGKCINALSGGMAIINDSIIRKQAEEAINRLNAASFSDEMILILKFMAYKVFFNPILYRLLYSISALNLGKTVFIEEFNCYKMNKLSKNIITRIVNRLVSIQKHRQNISHLYEELFKKYERYVKRFPEKNYYRYPLVIKNSEKVYGLLEMLVNAGIGSSRMYPVPLNNQDKLAAILNDSRSYKNAEMISKCLITFPVNEFIGEKEISQIDKICDKYFNG